MAVSCNEIEPHASLHGRCVEVNSDFGFHPSQHD